MQDCDVRRAKRNGYWSAQDLICLRRSLEKWWCHQQYEKYGSLGRLLACWTIRYAPDNANLVHRSSHLHLITSLAFALDHGPAKSVVYIGCRRSWCRPHWENLTDISPERWWLKIFLINSRWIYLPPWKQEINSFHACHCLKVKRATIYLIALLIISLKLYV